MFQRRCFVLCQTLKSFGFLSINQQRHFTDTVAIFIFILFAIVLSVPFWTSKGFEFQDSCRRIRRLFGGFGPCGRWRYQVSTATGRPTPSTTESTPARHESALRRGRGGGGRRIIPMIVGSHGTQCFGFDSLCGVLGGAVDILLAAVESHLFG